MTIMYTTITILYYLLIVFTSLKSTYHERDENVMRIYTIIAIIKNVIQL